MDYELMYQIPQFQVGGTWNEIAVQSTRNTTLPSLVLAWYFTLINIQ